MRQLGRIFCITVTVVILTLSLALADSKFPNKDTAKNRQDNAFGTKPRDGSEPVTTITRDANGTAIESTQPETEQVDWYDKVIISVEPEIKIEE